MRHLHLLGEVTMKVHWTAAHHGAAGCKRRQNLDQQCADAVHQRHARHRRLAARGDHQRVKQSDAQCQRLLNNERYNQFFQIFSGKK